jgi:hypothetical protein
MDFAALCFNRFYRLEIHSLMVGIFDQLVKCCPLGRRNYTCVLLPSTFSLTFSPPFPSKMYSIYRQCVAVGVGGVELCCRPYSAGVLHSVSE